ncbi:restriction endonuclease [Salinisphaera shabanensis]|uniref:restriction endonuclease n=1 Tax=Salinisphaera shabanensis TaxID=180542 RepID=UPI0033424BEC
MISDKERIIRWFYRQDWPEGELLFPSQLYQASRKVLGKLPQDAERYVHANQTRLWNALKKQQKLDISLGRYCLFRITDNSGMKAIWRRSLGIGTLSTATLRIETRWRARPHLLAAIDVLSDRQYEALGCVTSKLVGADYIHLTPPGNEGGIDFLCRIPAPARTHIFGGAHSPIRVVGQCKKYKSKVGVEKIRDFAKTLDDVRHRAQHLEQIVPHWFRSTPGPVIGWVIGHSGFQSGAVTISNNHGIVLSNSIDLGEVIATSKSFYEDFPPRGRASMLGKEIANFL